MTENPFADLNFNPPPRLRLSPRSLWMIVNAISFWILRWMLPSSVFSWITFFLFLLLAWAASFGWRSAIREIAAFVNKLERL